MRRVASRYWRSGQGVDVCDQFERCARGELIDRGKHGFEPVP
jgi:hypothetical protein